MWCNLIEFPAFFPGNLYIQTCVDRGELYIMMVIMDYHLESKRTPKCAVGQRSLILLLISRFIESVINIIMTFPQQKKIYKRRICTYWDNKTKWNKCYIVDSLSLKEQLIIGMKVLQMVSILKSFLVCFFSSKLIEFYELLCATHVRLITLFIAVIDSFTFLSLSNSSFNSN